MSDASRPDSVRPARDADVPPVRVLVAVVSHGRSKTLEDMAKGVADLLRETGFRVVRNVVAQGEPTYISQLVSNVSNENEADAIVMIGGTGFGPRDNTCETIDGLVERRIEGFGEAYRKLLRDEFDQGARAMLSRATAGVYNRCVVFAFTGRPGEVTSAVRSLVVPVLGEAASLATGRTRAHDR
jgi:molybdenum cofactor biosynthesis protein B